LRRVGDAERDPVDVAWIAVFAESANGGCAEPLALALPERPAFTRCWIMARSDQTEVKERASGYCGRMIESARRVRETGKHGPHLYRKLLPIDAIHRTFALHLHV
jgi:hypothetical protein